MSMEQKLIELEQKIDKIYISVEKTRILGGSLSMVILWLLFLYV